MGISYNMIKKSVIAALLVISLLTVTSYTSAIQESILKYNNDPSDDYTHTVLVEFGTFDTCGHCPPVSNYIHSLYQQGLEFYYVTLNTKVEPARSRNKELPENGGVPIVWGDGGYTTIRGNAGSINPYEEDINECGQRNVKNIDLKLSLTWDDKKIGINLEVTNKEQTNYNGHLHVYITEIESRWGYTNGDNFHYAMLDYAINKDITIQANNKKQYTEEWDGKNSKYPDIEQKNIMIIASVFTKQNMYTDETIALKASEAEQNQPPNQPKNPKPNNQEKEIKPNTKLEWTCTDPDNDPLTYDIYLGTTPNPQKIKNNHPTNTYTPETPLKTGQKYYWKIKAKDNHQNTKTGNTWSFTINEKSTPTPPKETLEINIQKGFTIGFFGLNIFGKINVNIENNCDSSANYSIVVKKLSSKEEIRKENGSIKEKGSKTITIKRLFDIGLIEINAVAKNDVAYVTDKTLGLILGPVILLSSRQ